MIALLAAALIAGVPPAPDPYRWVCGYLDAAPTVFGVMGLPAEAERRGLDPDPAAIIAAVDANCPGHAELIASLPLVLR